MGTTSPPRSVVLLDSAVAYTRSALQPARRTPLDLPTPCHGWALGHLLLHMEDSLEAITEAAEIGVVTVEDNPRRRDADRIVERLVQRACGLHGAWTARLTSAPVAVGDLVLGRDTLVMVGALEIAVHGWDVAETTGWPSPLPEDLAVDLLEVAQAVVTPADRGRRFGPARVVPPTASAGTRLLAHLGRG
jgi:uncharacterized protein (TIGR03086 family)